MRTRYTLINLAYTLGSSLIMLLLGLITRRLFVINFGDFIPGTVSVVEKLFSFFSIAEFGVGSVISYHLYEQIAAKDAHKTSLYMSLYKWAYRCIGFAITVIALVCALFLPVFITENGQEGADMGIAYSVYFLNLLSTLTTYFLVTRRLMYTCTQRGFVCTRIDLACSICTYLARIAIALCIPNYILYCGVAILFNTLANLVIARQFRKDFPEVQEVKVTWADFKELGLFRDLKYYLVHRLSNAVYGTSDSLVTSMVLGTSAVTPMANYTTLADSATNIGYKITDSFAAAIGNIVYDKNAQANDHGREVFWGMDLFAYGFGSFVAVAYFCLFQPFIRLWMGESYLLSTGFVLMFCLNEYVGWNHKMLGSYRSVLGRFEEDQWFMVASGTVNLLLSFILIRPYGFAGVVAATVVAHSIMWAGRVRVVFRFYMPGHLGHYLAMQAAHLVTLAAAMLLTARLCAPLPQTIPGLIGRGVIVCILPNLINLVCYGWTRDAAYLRGWAGRLLSRFRNK